MGICFVMQPYDDGGEFDKRYTELLAPAIKIVGLTPYRVDCDKGTTVIIERIHESIEQATLCLADITLPNPNVWYEVGYAMAKGKEIVFICESGIKCAFDIGHRRIEFYKKGSTSDFETLKQTITERMQALLNNGEVMKKITASPLNVTEGLSQSEMIVLASIMQNRDFPESSVYKYLLDNDMERAGVNKLGTNMALTTLLKKGMVSYKMEEDINSDKCAVYFLTPVGENWLVNNCNKLNFSYTKQVPEYISKPIDDIDDDTPF